MSTHLAEWTLVVMSILSVLGVPTLVLLVRGAVKWTHAEDKLAELVDDMHKLVADKDRIHAEILAQMHADREATDRRLRFLEEFWMLKGREAMTERHP